MVAEGVETHKQIEYLQKLECELGQGNLFLGAASGRGSHKILPAYARADARLGTQVDEERLGDQIQAIILSGMCGAGGE